MKQYTNESQTAKLIELGLPKPKFEIETQLCNIKGQPMRAATIVGDYSIGELIEMLPEVLAPLSDPDNEMMLNISTDSLMWTVRYGEGEFIPYETISYELINALYDMIIKLKDEEVI